SRLLQRKDLYQQISQFACGIRTSAQVSELTAKASHDFFITSQKAEIDLIEATARKTIIANQWGPLS
ncbi:MAG: hypothetical protein ACFCUR_20655, partial [Rhodomicrobiaceae bacterium]